MNSQPQVFGLGLWTILYQVSHIKKFFPLLGLIANLPIEEAAFFLLFICQTLKTLYRLEGKELSSDLCSQYRNYLILVV